ncbi:unnamed protein product, partial [Prorocentrum cordatum]
AAPPIGAPLARAVAICQPRAAKRRGPRGGPARKAAAPRREAMAEGRLALSAAVPPCAGAPPAPVASASEGPIGDFCGSLRLQVQVLRRCLEAQQVPLAASEPATAALLEAIGAAGRDLRAAAAASRERRASGQGQESGAFLRQRSADSVPPPDGLPARAPRCTSSPVLLKSGGAGDGGGRVLPRAHSDLLEDQHAELMERLGQAGAAEPSGPRCRGRTHDAVGRGTSSGSLPGPPRVGDEPFYSEDRQRKLAAEIEHLKVRDSLGSGSARMSSLQACRQDSTPRGVLRRIVGSSAFELFFCMVIVANAAWIGLEVNYQAGVQEGQRCRRCQSQAFLAVGHAFTALFAVELSIRLGAEGLRFFHGRSSNAFWNYFDTAIVAISLFEVFLEVASLLDGGGTDWANLRVLRIMRITRLLRVIRVTRIFRYVRALRTLVYSIACTLKSLFWASVLLMLIMYVFGILFTSAASASASSLEERGLLEQDVLVLERYWSSVGTSMFTLFKAMTSGVAWDEVVRPLGQIHWFWPMLFTAFIAFSVFAVLNGCTVADDRGLLPERDRERRARPRAARPVPDSGQGPLRQPRQVAVPGDRQGRVWHHHHRGVGAAAAGLGGPRLAAVARDRRRRRLDAV